MSELKPCPFCGTAPTFDLSDVDEYGQAWDRLSCPSCHAYVERALNKDGTGSDVVERWNHRAADTRADASDAKCEQWYCDSDATLCAIGDNREALCPAFALSLHGQCAEAGKHRFAVYLDRPIQPEVERLRQSLRTVRAMAADMTSGNLSAAVMAEWSARIVDGCNAMLGE